MPVTLSDLKAYGSAVMPDDDTVLNIGGAVDLTRTVEWNQVRNSTLQAVSSAAGDTTQSVTVSYRNAAGTISTLVIALNGQTVVTNATSVVRLLKAIKSATTTGNMAVENQTAIRTGTAQGAGSGTNTILLDAGASAVDDFYRGLIIRLTGGTGQFQIGQITGYNGTTKEAIIDKVWTTPPDATSTFRLSEGMYFAKTPAEVSEVRLPFFNAAADATVVKTYYDKIFLKNTHATLSLLSSTVKEFADPQALVTFALATAVNDTGGNGGGNNRQVAPSAGVTAFDNADKNVPGGGTLAAADRIGVWLKLTLVASAAAQDTTYTPLLSGSST